ncbi:MAG: DinB family protein [Anaerolineae bacterium]|nr:DinB family protein [Anaerolineae bacterium]
MMSDKSQLFAHLDQTRAETESVFASIDSNTLIYADGEWTLKDIIGHLSAWEQAAVTCLQAHAEGGEARLPVQMSDDEYNHLNVARRKNFSIEKILLEWQETREWLKQVIEEMPDDQFMSEMTYPEGERGSATQLVEEMIEHELEHRQDIIGVLKNDPS